MSSGLFKNVIYKVCLLIIYFIYMQKKRFGVERPTMVDMPWNQTKPIIIIIIIIIIMSCWLHGYPWPSLATFPNRSSPQAGLLDNIPYPHIVAECMFVLRPAFARPCVGVHKSTSLMSSSLLLQQCPACQVRLTKPNHAIKCHTGYWNQLIIHISINKEKW